MSSTDKVEIESMEIEKDNNILKIDGQMEEEKTIIKLLESK